MADDGKQISVRFSAEEVELLTARAEAAGQKLTPFVREMVMRSLTGELARLARIEALARILLERAVEDDDELHEMIDAVNGIVA